MRADATPAEIEAILREIIRDNRPGEKPGSRTFGNHLEVYDRAIQKRILEPLLKARAEAGLAEPIDDLGHDTYFAKAWGRALDGTSKEWDCRELAVPFVRAACRGVPYLWDKLFSGQLEAIDTALIKNLPGILTGKGFIRPTTFNGLNSWVTGERVWLRMSGLKPVLCNKDGSDLAPPRDIISDFDIGPKSSAPLGREWIGLMSFHATGIDHDEGDKAFRAWFEATREIRSIHDRGERSMASLALVTLKSFDQLGILSFELRQDEWLSVQAGDEGFTVYRGAVEGLKQIVDEGLFLCGPRTKFMEMLEKGGFSKAGAGHYLDRLAQTSRAFSATVPEGFRCRACLDAETLYGFDMADHDTVHVDTVEEALPIFAAGTMEMPEMLSHRARKARAAEPAEAEINTPGL